MRLMCATLPLFLMVMSCAHPLRLAAGEESLRLYDISDLIAPLRDFPPPALGQAGTRLLLGQVDAPLQPEPADLLGDPPSARLVGILVPVEPPLDPLVALERTLETDVSPTMAAALRKPGALKGVKADSWFLTATPAQHDAVQRVLTRLRESRQVQIRVDILLYRMSPRQRQAFADQSDLPWISVPDQPGVSVAAVTAAEAWALDDLMRAQRADAGVKLLSAQITCFAGQLANTAVTKQIRYQPVTIRDGRKGPIQATVVVGDTIAIRVSPHQEPSVITLTMEHHRAAVVDWRTIDLGAGSQAREPVVWTGGELIERRMTLDSALVIAPGLSPTTAGSEASIIVLLPILVRDN